MPINDFETSRRSDLECTGVRAIGGSSALVALATIRIPAFGLTFVGCAVFSSSGKRWVNLPSKQEKGGGYVPTVAFDDADMTRNFSDAAIEAIGQFDPAFFEGRR